MTDYGRGQGSEPWHPEDPLFGDQGYQQQDAWDPYATGQQPQYPYNGQQAPQQQYPQQEQQPQHQQYPHQQQYPQQQGQYGQQEQYQQQGYPQQQQQQYPQQGHPQQQGHQQQGHPQQYNDWDTSGVSSAPYGANPGDPYGGQPPADPYGQQPDFYGQGGYPPPQQPQHRQPEQHQPEQQPQQPMRSAPENTGDWEAESEPETHAFFADDTDEAEPEEEAPAGRGGRKRGGKSGKKEGKKRRSGCACLVVLLVLGGGVGGVGYFGYQFYESHFGAAPDFSGEGTGDVQVEIPKGSTLTDMGNILKTAGVVKSVDAFTAAAGKNPKGKSIQAGIFLLHKEMSAASAVTMMTDPSKQSAIIIPEGRRATEIYEAIDKRLGAKAGTTLAASKGADLGLPAWAQGNVEGFLFPAKYSVGKATKPVDLLKAMVKQAEAEYAKDNIEVEARKVNKTPLQIVTIASLIQAEAQQDDEFGKVSRVIYNRLDKDMALGFDSTINYAMGRSTLNTSTKDTKFPSPYNTYLHKGLPPGPIGNPGHQAIDAALHPTAGNWLYFVTVKENDTRFTDSYTEHQKNVQEFNKNKSSG
ncbi:endolytic transglycosylase MltG [Streptomyces sp. NPDC006733]|uniref:endolytic transglycosylase MltG n=1 Tax=Streptomyces sp. NPDC006733 TaxID=3155460 RepID=UPI003401FEF8